MFRITDLILSRAWLPIIALEYGRALPSAPDKVMNRNAIEQLAAEGLQLWRLAPWHIRILVGGAEIAASLWSVGYRLAHLGRYVPADELRAFSKVPVISAPLLRLYRSLIALHWFEHPLLYAAYGITETPKQRQETFRAKRDRAVST